MPKTDLSPPPPPSAAVLEAARSFGLGALRQTPKGFFPWSSIKDVGVSGGFVQIKQEGKFLLLSHKKVGQIPNLPLFMILAETLKRQATGNGSPSNVGT